jgi:hypothetical protein
VTLPLRLAAALCCITCIGSTHAETIPAPATPATAANATSATPAPASAVAPGTLLVPANTVVQLELLEEVSSKTGNPGNFFRLRLAEPLAINGTLLLPAGTPAIGEIVHVQKASVGGKAGELLIAARYIDAPQGRIKLRSSFGAVGKDHSNVAIGVTTALGPVGFIVSGGQKILNVGTLLSARIAAETPLALPAATPAVAPAALPAAQATISPPQGVSP